MTKKITIIAASVFAIAVCLLAVVVGMPSIYFARATPVASPVAMPDESSDEFVRSTALVAFQHHWPMSVLRHEEGYSLDRAYTGRITYGPYYDQEQTKADRQLYDPTGRRLYDKYGKPLKETVTQSRAVRNGIAANVTVIVPSKTGSSILVGMVRVTPSGFREVWDVTSFFRQTILESADNLDSGRGWSDDLDNTKF